HIVDPARRDAHLQRLTAAGIDPATAHQRGQLELYTWPEAPVREGACAPERLRALLAAVSTGARQHGFPPTRCVSQMGWAVAVRVGVVPRLEYEAKAHSGQRCDQDPVSCTYALAQCGGGMVVDILRTHPMILIGGLLYENPFCVPPEDSCRHSTHA